MTSDRPASPAPSAAPPHAHPHDAVLPLDDEPTAAPFARSYTVAVLGRWLAGRAGHADVVDAAALITTELVTNALRHSTPDTLRLELRDTCVLITVTDTNTRLPVLRAPDPGDTGGRGLELVTAFASRFGCRRFTGRKAVWAELTIPSPAGPPQPPPDAQGALVGGGKHEAGPGRHNTPA
ncbi:hypothetical protein GPA10_11025 [Streptomyces sp. p1417]|uniref:Histidine kinase/HSP90-like ATPase domain-containing protein n=1 Tax=Streptomyces typhae TaxID=2681492 RepID=A0A6L6WX55_9ACTN|nr:ATP-binding protein [Streptomyces typhae]MVO85271.1 hypothetical protein [Streptomyces typhae]